MVLPLGIPRWPSKFARARTLSRLHQLLTAQLPAGHRIARSAGSADLPILRFTRLFPDPREVDPGAPQKKPMGAARLCILRLSILSNRWLRFFVSSFLLEQIDPGHSSCCQHLNKRQKRMFLGIKAHIFVATCFCMLRR